MGQVLSLQHGSDAPLPRRFLAGILALGLAGTLAELILLEHSEGFWQKAPLAVIGCSLLVLAAAAARPRRGCMRAVQVMMALLMAASFAGLFMHFQGNREFEIELHPDQTGWPHIWAVLKGATPTLAPGMLIVLGLLGFAWTYRFPVFISTQPPQLNQQSQPKDRPS